MSITLSWNGGANVAMIQPSNKVLIGGLAVFGLGLLFLGLLGCAVLVGVGLVLWNVGTVLLHLMIAVVATDLLVQGVGCLILIFSLLCVGLFFLRYIWSALRSAKPLNEGMHS